MTKQINFTFNHDVLTPNDNITVVKFTGDEGISTLFEFSIELKSSNPDLDIDAILESPASLEISFIDDVRKIQGIISHFDAVRQVNNETIYTATLVPRLWELSLYHTNEVYLEQTVSEIIETVLQEAGFTSLDYDLSDIEGNDVTDKVWPYKCQYGETHLDFISRLMERDGIYYYFVEGEVGEKVVFCNTLNRQEAIVVPDVLYSPMSSLEINSLENTVNSFVSQQKRVPYKVLVKDYNDDKPSVDIKGEAIIDEKANKSSEIYVWGQNIESPEEGEVLAQIRAEELLAAKRTYHGESSVVRLLTGFNFTLKDHFRATCNQEYLLLNIRHEASNPSALDFSGGIADAMPPVYTNTFSAIAADVQFRSEVITSKPEIHGTLNAFVDSEGDGQYAEVDEEGRYRITMPFDRIDRDGGKASHYVRMSQPFSGENQGMHFPLRKGAEVLLTFIGGDPDRPVIAGSIPNASQPSVVNADNHTNSMIKTGAGNKIELEDKDGKNRIKLQTGDDKTYMHLGAPNHPGDGFVVMSAGIERKEITGGQQLTTVVSTCNDYTTTGTTSHISSEETNNDLITESDFFEFEIKNSNGHGTRNSEMTREDELSGAYLIERRIGDKYLYTDGHEYSYGGGNAFEFGNGYTEVHANEDGCDESEVWPSVGNRLGVPNVVGLEADASNGDPSQQGIITTLETKIENLEADLILFDENSPFGYLMGDPNFSIETTFNRNLERESIESSLKTAKEGIAKPKTEIVSSNALVEKVWADTFSYQSGNNYAWGDTCEYNFGDGYEENHMDEDSEINRDDSNDRADIGGPDWTEISTKSVTGFSPGNVWVSKSYGNAYDYVKGNSLEVIDGGSESHVYGNSHDEVHGHAVETIRGSSRSTHHGATHEFFLGASNAMMVGAASDISLAGAFDMFVGGKIDITLAAALELNFGASSALKIGFHSEFESIKFKNTATEADNAAAKINNAISRLENDVNAIHGDVNAIYNGIVKIENKATVLENAIVTLMS